MINQFSKSSEKYNFQCNSNSPTEKSSANAVTALYNSGSSLSASTNSGNYISSGNLVFYLQMQQNLDDSENSYDFTGRNISSSDYTNTSFD